MLKVWHIQSVEAENRRLREALELSVNVLQQILDKNQLHSSSTIVWRQAVEAKTKARSALRSKGA